MMGNWSFAVSYQGSLCALPPDLPSSSALGQAALHCSQIPRASYIFNRSLWLLWREGGIEGKARSRGFREAIGQQCQHNLGVTWSGWVEGIAGTGRT